MKRIFIGAEKYLRMKDCVIALKDYMLFISLLNHFTIIELEKSTIGLKTVEYSPDSPDSHEESFDNDINNNINSQTQDETHDGIGQNKNSFWHKQG